MVFQQRLEEVSFRYSCGNLLFDDNSHVGSIITHCQQLNCELQVEKSYYNCPGRKLELPDVCIHCGSTGTADYLFGQDELEAQNKTGGKKCYPIYQDCLVSGKKVVAYPKQKANQAKKRKEGAARLLDKRAKKSMD